MPFRGKIEALAGVRSYLEEIRQDYVVLMEGDLVVNLPLAEIQAEHVKSGADITVVCGNDSFATAGGSYFEVDKDGRVTEVLYNLNTPRGYRGLEVYILSTKLLKELVDECYAKAKEIILENQDVLHKCCGLLLEKEKIGQEEFEALFDK